MTKIIETSPGGGLESSGRSDAAAPARTHPVNDAVRAALDNDVLFDITTTGRNSGEPRRIEIWVHSIDGFYYITGKPNGRRRGWYDNLVAEPRLTVHVKESLAADLPAVARLIDDEAERQAVLPRILHRQRDVRGIAIEGELPDWLAESPLVEVTIPSP